MYKIIEIVSELYKDLNKRTITAKVVLKLYLISKSKSINLDIITDIEFDLIYKTYIYYLIKNMKKSKIHGSYWINIFSNLDLAFDTSEPTFLI
jgi:hypothetical protein